MNRKHAPIHRFTTQVDGRSYDTDGQRFLMTRDTPPAGETRDRVVVVFNWFEELKRLVPRGE